MELKLTSQFKKDLKRHKHNTAMLLELKKVLQHLQDKGTVPDAYLPHPLRGDYHDCMECHVRNDFLLIWLDRAKGVIKLLRLGSHAELFGKGLKR